MGSMPVITTDEIALTEKNMDMTLGSVHNSQIMLCWAYPIWR